MSNNNVRNYIVTVPAKTGAGVVTVNFETIKELENAAIIKVETYHVGLVTVTPTAQPLVTQAVVNKSYVQFKISNMVVREIPLRDLVVEGARQQVEDLNLPNIDLSSCQVVTAGGAGITAGEYFMFKFTYTKTA